MNRKEVVAWAAYDWANSAVNTIVFTFVFSVYFAKSIYGNEVAGSAAWSYAQGWAGVVVALFAPLLGAAIDRYGPHKPVLKILTVFCIAVTATLYLMKPESSYIVPALILGGLLTIGFEFLQTVYNSTLPLVAKSEVMGKVSSLGWGAGYVGSIFCLGLILVLFIGVGDAAGLTGIPKDGAEHVRATMLFTGLWFAVFAIPYFLYCPDSPRTGLGLRASFSEGLTELRDMFRDAKGYPDIIRFLVASAIYRDGLATLFAVGGLYAAGTLHMSFSEVMIFAIAINIASGIGAWAFAFIDDRIGAKTTVMISLAALILFGGCVLTVTDKTLFIAFACALGLFIGPVQASSRTMLAQMAPPEKTGSFFGVYAMTGKAVSFMGPFAFALMTDAFQSQRAGMGSIIAFWTVGLIMIHFVRFKRQKV